jgi:hypothetical protein
VVAVVAKAVVAVRVVEEVRVVVEALVVVVLVAMMPKSTSTTPAPSPLSKRWADDGRTTLWFAPLKTVFLSLLCRCCGAWSSSLSRSLSLSRT